MVYDIDSVVGLEEANREMDKAIHALAPKCHFKTMTFKPGDYDSFESDKWVCECCGHTKDAELNQLRKEQDDV